MQKWEPVLRDVLYAGTQQFMDFMGVPDVLLPLVIVTEIVAGPALLVSWQARITAVALADFSILSGFLVRYRPSLGLEGQAAQREAISFLEKVTIAGGMVTVIAFGPGRLSLKAG